MRQPLRSVVVASSIALLSLASVSAAQEQLGAKMPTISAAQIRFIEIKQKLDPNARGLFDRKRGHYVNISGRLSLPAPMRAPSDAVRIVARFLTLHRAIFGLPDAASERRCNAEPKHREAEPQYVRCQQVIGDIPVSGAVLTASVNRKGIVTSIDTTFQANVPRDAPVTPALSEDTARASAEADYGGDGTWKGRGLSLFRDEHANTWRLVYTFDITDPHRYLRYRVDALSGNIVAKLNLAREKDCMPTNAPWQDSSGDDYSVPVCMKDGERLLSTGPDHSPAPYETHDMSIDDDLVVSYLTWPPTGDHAEGNVRAHARANLVLDYYHQWYNQDSWCKDLTSPCPLLLSTFDENGMFAGKWIGNGHIVFSFSSGISATTIAHEICHGIVDSFYTGDDASGYCDNQHPEPSAVEEGMCEMFGSFLANEMPNNSPITYAGALEDLNTSITEHHGIACKAHEFGIPLFNALASRLLVGMSNGKQPVGLDVTHLLEPLQVGTLFMETIRHKQTWRHNMDFFGSALLSTCTDLAEETPAPVVTSEHCKNVERALLSLGITPNVSLGVELLGPQAAPSFPIDLSLPFVEISSQSYFSSTGQPHLRFSFLPEVVVAVPPPAKYGPLDILLNTSEVDAVTKNSLSLPICTISAKDSSANATPSLCSKSFFWWVDDPGLLDHAGDHLLIDLPRKYLFSAQATPPATSIAAFPELSPADNVVAMTVAPDFSIDAFASLAPDGEQPLCPKPLLLKLLHRLGLGADPCPKKRWAITVAAINIGNKPTFPIVRPYVFGPNPKETPAQVYGLLSAYEQQLLGLTPSQLAESEDVKRWRSGDQLVDGGRLPLTDDKGHPKFIFPGASFDVARRDVIAQSGDQYIIALFSPIPEQGLLNNILSLTLKEGEDSSTCLPPTSPACQLRRHNWEQLMVELAQDIEKEIQTSPTVSTRPPIGPDPVFDDLLFNPGERVLFPANPDGTYPPGAMSDAIQENRKMIEMLRAPLQTGMVQQKQGLLNSLERSSSK